MNDIWIPVTLFLEMILCFICIYTVFQKKVEINRHMVGIIFTGCFIYYLINRKIVEPFCAIAVYGLFFWYCMVQFRLSLGNTIFKLMVAFTLMGILEAAALCFAIPFQNKGDIKIIGVVSGMGANFLAVMLAFFVKQRKRIAKSFLRQNLLWSGLLYSVAIFSVLVDYYINQTMITYRIVISLTVMLFIYIYMYMTEQTKREIEKKNVALELEKIYSNAYEELLEGIRIRQHNFKNQISAIYSMHLTATSLDELVKMQRAYGEHILKEGRFDSILTCCNQPVLAGYIYYKCILCEKMGIAVSYHIKIDQAVCAFSEYEMIELLGIFIDNACENLLCNKELPAKMELEFLEDNDKIKFTCRNPVMKMTSGQIEQLFKKGYSTKGEKRGIGLARARKMAVEHGTEIVVKTLEVYNQHWLEFNIVIKK